MKKLDAANFSTEQRLHILQNILNTARMGVWQIGLSEGAPAMYADNVMLQLMGLDPEDCTLTSEDVYTYWYDHIHPDYISAVDVAREKMAKDEVYEHIYAWIHPTLGKRYLRSGGKLTWEEGSPVVSGYFYDVTNQVQHDMEMNRLTEALAMTYFSLFLVDLKTGLFSSIHNPAYLLEVVGETGVATNAFDVFISTLVEKEYQYSMYEFTNQKTLSSRLKDVPSLTYEYKSKKMGWCRAHWVPVERDEQGQLTKVLYAVKNIDENKVKELQLKQQLETHMKTIEENYQMINYLAKTFNSIYYIDMHTGHFIELGTSLSAVHSLIGESGDAQSRFELMCKYIVAPDDADKMRAFADLKKVRQQLLHTDRLAQGFRSNINGWSEGMFLAGDRGPDGYCNHIFWTTRNVNEQKAKELEQQAAIEAALKMAEEASQAKTSFLFNMSHDIRTPMNAIIGFTNLLKKHQEDVERREDYLRKIEDSSTVLLSIINNVLEMARIEKGTLEIDETAWSTEQFNDTLYSVFYEMMNQKGLTFTREINVQDGYVFCDPIKLREIFLNILSNAYKYTNTGGKVHMHLEQIPCDRSGYALYRTTISDTGMGMSAEFLPHIFEEFSREHNSTETKIEGTGLGMPIVKRLVEMLDGTIEVQSQLGKGSTFIVTLPHKIADRSNLVDHGGVELDPKIFEGKRILLAEDNDLNAEIAIEILQEVGLILERAEDGMVCVEKLKQAEANYYDLVLMDIQMPRMNGYEATRAIRSLSDHTKSQIPILAMTANAFEEDKRDALRAGMNGHLGKPINIAALMKELAFILN